ncbi:MAG: metallophosphoesterase family protein [Caldilineaceae bacterium]|nr:metallophosphoesterase family protein [Caldilineaceae bacterium]
MRIAILADIHGNLPALEAVVADLQTQAPDLVYLAGDQINRCPWNNEVMDLIDAWQWPAIYGNHEWIVAHLGTEKTQFAGRDRFPSLWWTRENLSPNHLATVCALPAERRLDLDDGPAIRLLHGVRGDPFVGMLPEAADAVLAAYLEPMEESVVISAHTHRPLARRVGRWQLFNPGSVGMPYNGDPRGQYMLLQSSAQGWQPIFRQVDYDRGRVAVAYRESGFQAACGPMAELYLRTVETGEPWASDFAYWMRFQTDELKHDPGRAVAAYVQQHGPGNWAFQLG